MVWLGFFPSSYAAVGNQTCASSVAQLRTLYRLSFTALPAAACVTDVELQDLRNRLLLLTNTLEQGSSLNIQEMTRSAKNSFLRNLLTLAADSYPQKHLRK